MKHKFKKVFAAAIGSVLMAGAAIPVVYADDDTTATMPASDLQHIKLIDDYNPEGIKDKPLQNASIGLCERMAWRSFYTGKFVGYNDPYNHDPSQVKTFTTDEDGLINITAADFVKEDGKEMDLYPSGEWNPKGTTTYKGELLYYSDRVVTYDDGMLKYDTRNASVSADGHTLIIQAEPVKFMLKIKHVTADKDIPELGALNSNAFLNYEIRDAAGNALTPTGSGETKYTVRWGERYTYHQIPDASDADFYANDFDFTPLYGDNTDHGSQDVRYAAYYHLDIPTGHKVTLIESPRQNGTIDEIGLLRGKHTAYEAMVKNGGAEIKDADTGESFGGWRQRLVKNGDEVKLSNAVFPFINPRLFADSNRPADASTGGAISWGEHEGPESSWGVLYKGDLKIYHFDARWMDDDTNTIVGGNGTTYQILRKQGTTEKWMVAIPQVVGDDYTITLPTVSDVGGYTFDGWYTKQDGGTRLGGSGEQATLNYDGTTWDEMTDKDMDLMTGRMYGHWTKNPEYTIAYDGNGATSGHMDAEIYKTDADVSLTANDFAKDGYTFVGWATAPDGEVVYNDKADIGKVSKVAVTDNKLTVYAQWQRNTVWDGLTVDKIVDKDIAKPGDTLTYTITVSNKTGKDLTDVTVSDTLDSRLTFVSADSKAYSNGAWTIDSLKDGGSATLTLTAKVNDDVADKAVIPNTAIITGAHADDGNMPDDHHAEDETQTTVNVPINWDGLSVSKTVDKDAAKPGDTLTYTVTVTNDTGKYLTGITVTDKLDDSLTLVTADNDEYSDGVWTIDDLKDGETKTLTLTASVNNDVKDGTVIPNTAVITDAHNGDEGLPSDNHPSDKVETKVDIPTDWTKLTIEKKADKDSANPGDQVTYTITVANNTGKNLTDVQVSDPLDKALIFASSKASVGAYDSESGFWKINALKDGEQASLVIVANVKDDVADGMAIPNAAVITDAHNGDESLPKDNLPGAEVDVTVVKPEMPVPEIHKVTYDGNGGNGTMDATVIADDGTVTLDVNKFTRDGYTFSGWATSADGDAIYKDGEKLTDQGKDLTLYAVWEKVPDKATDEKKSPDTGVHADTSVIYAGIGLVAGFALLLTVILTAKHRKSE